MKDCYNKCLTCDDFRGIAISSIFSKVFEHCVIKRYESFLISSELLVRILKGVGCTYAIRSVRKVKLIQQMVALRIRVPFFRCF